ncbi:hypothetical protein M9Y10_031134 [Tritrichomonas musculus]|uniref:Myb-like DNA-binding domain containing protein n=1 Tax=Tritrichomonas musculus TaxID=1915356 RepID=A0ABR2H1V3_9EUKA
MITPTGQTELNNINFFEMMNLNPNSIFNTDNNNENNNSFNSNVKKRKYRRKFTPEEDQKLRELIEKYGDHSWNIVSSLMENRNQRQCRERWKHYLSCDPEEASKPWSPSEDRIIIKKYKELGAKWTKIARELPGRSDLQVKIRYLKHLKNKKRRNKYKYKESESSDQAFSDDETDDDKSIKDNENKNKTSNNDEGSNNNNSEQVSSNANTSNTSDSDLGFNLGLRLTPINIITNFFNCTENSILFQDFESDFLDWSYQ